MEKLMKGDNILAEYSPQRVSRDSPKTTHMSSEDVDFNDVFGGPPRRVSMQEVRVRYSFGETVESEEERSPWMLLKEKPVFGEEITPRRRRQGDDFYGDIFGGDESYGSPSRKNDSVFGSNPGSRIMSPARSLMPKAEPYGTSLPIQFSLPSTLKALEHPVFASRNNSTNGLNSPRSSNTSLSRFSNRGKDEIRNRRHHQSSLSREASFSSEDYSQSDEKGNTEKVKKETKNVDSNENLFHFSIYKWAGTGVPMLITLMGMNNLKSKDVNGNYCLEKKSIVRNKGFSVHKEPLSLKTEIEKNDSTIKEDAKKVQNSTSVLDKIPDRNKAKDNAGFGEASKIMKSKQVKSQTEMAAKETVEEKGYQSIKDFLKSTIELEKTENISNIKGKTMHHTKNEKKNAGTGIDVNRENVVKSSSQDGKKGRVKGKVKQFVQIFNQETDTKPKADVQERSQSFRWKDLDIGRKESEVSSHVANVKDNANLQNVDKKPDVSNKVDEDIMKDESEKYHFTQSSSYTSNDVPINQKTAVSSDDFVCFAEPITRESEIFLEDPDDHFEENFQVEELSDDHEKNTQSGEGSDDTKALDSKIRQWSVGKKGNIRSLLSTLQYILWPESGWKAVPLVDLIEANSVKKAYQKALLRLHPDKLQQKGAASSHKYIAEKVFDILQEAWDHFNTLAPL